MDSVHWCGMKLPSVAVAGVLSDSMMIHTTGTSEQTTITDEGRDQPSLL